MAPLTLQLNWSSLIQQSCHCQLFNISNNDLSSSDRVKVDELQAECKSTDGGAAGHFRGEEQGVAPVQVKRL